MKRTLVKTVMTKDVISIEPQLAVDVAIEVMNSNDIRRLPVLSDRGRLVGIITLYDAMLAMPKDTTFSGSSGDIPKIRDVMTDYVYTVGPDDSIADAAQIMLNHQVGGVPVVEDRAVVGIITESDLFKFLARELHLLDDAAE